MTISYPIIIPQIRLWRQSKYLSLTPSGVPLESHYKLPWKFPGGHGVVFRVYWLVRGSVTPSGFDLILIGLGN
jgi:hypothetical protein